MVPYDRRAVRAASVPGAEYIRGRPVRHRGDTRDEALRKDLVSADRAPAPQQLTDPREIAESRAETSARDLSSGGIEYEVSVFIRADARP